jgi:hypothetical protein
MDKRELSRLRNLAATYAEYAHGAPMRERREKWRLHNRLERRTFPFHIEDNGTFFREHIPALQCTSGEGRWLEGSLLWGIVSYEKIDDDRIIPDRFVVDWVTEVSSFCDELTITRAEDGHGGELGYRTSKPIKDIDGDFGKLKKRTMALRRETTEARAELAQDAFQGLMPVAVGRPSSMYSDGIANKAVHLMGMQELFLTMAENPAAVHRLFSFLADNNAALGAWEEEQGLLTTNNDGNQGYCSGSSQFSDEVPGRAVAAGEKILSADRWGYLEAQEATGVSPDMFGEFFMPYFEKLARAFRLMKFGCCEPVHDLMGHLQKLPGLRKVSVTPWCNQEKLAGCCRRDIIWSRKPVPLKLCSEAFDPAAFRAHLQETLDFGRDYFIEFIFRDTTRLTGAMEGRLAEACRIVRDMTGHPEGRR